MCELGLALAVFFDEILQDAGIGRQREVLFDLRVQNCLQVLIFLLLDGEGVKQILDPFVADRNLILHAQFEVVVFLLHLLHGALQLLVLVVALLKVVDLLAERLLHLHEFVLGDLQLLTALVGQLLGRLQLILQNRNALLQKLDVLVGGLHVALQLVLVHFLRGEGLLQVLVFLNQVLQLVSNIQVSRPEVLL